LDSPALVQKNRLLEVGKGKNPAPWLEADLSRGWKTGSRPAAFGLETERWKMWFLLNGSLLPKRACRLEKSRLFAEGEIRREGLAGQQPGRQRSAGGRL